MLEYWPVIATIGGIILSVLGWSLRTQIGELMKRVEASEKEVVNLKIQQAQTSSETKFLQAAVVEIKDAIIAVRDYVEKRS